MKSVIPPKLGLVKTLISPCTPCVSGISITQILRISRREIPLALLAFSLSGSLNYYKVPSTLSPISDLCTPCTRSLCKVLGSCGWLCTPCTNHFALLTKGKFMLSLLSFRIETNPVNTFLAFCVHTLHHFNRREKIETYPNIHNSLYS